MNTCYMCERRATSQEHAPPKCIFPERKDVASGADYRKELISVPSCDLHNTAKSTEDEYLMYVLPASIATNEVGINQFLTKVQRAIRRRPALAGNIAGNAKTVIVHDTEKNVWFRTYAVPIDMARIYKVLEMNARAIYYDHYGAKFIGEIKVYSNFSLSLASVRLNDVQSELFKKAETFLNGSPRNGENQQVFYYRLAREAGMELMEFTFYGVSRALAVLKHG